MECNNIEILFKVDAQKDPTSREKQKNKRFEKRQNTHLKTIDQRVY